MKIKGFLLESNPIKARKYIYFGNYRYLKKDYEGALEYYRKALVKNFFDDGIHFNLAITKEKLFDFSGALESYYTSLELNTTNSSRVFFIKKRIKVIKKKLQNFSGDVPRNDK